MIVKWEKKHQERSVHAYSRHLTTKASVQRIRDNIITSNSSKLAVLTDGIFVLAHKCANRKKGESCHFPKKKKKHEQSLFVLFTDIKIIFLHEYIHVSVYTHIHAHLHISIPTDACMYLREFPVKGLTKC